MGWNHQLTDDPNGNGHIARAKGFGSDSLFIYGDQILMSTLLSMVLLYPFVIFYCQYQQYIYITGDHNILSIRVSLWIFMLNIIINKKMWILLGTGIWTWFVNIKYWIMMNSKIILFLFSRLLKGNVFFGFQAQLFHWMYPCMVLGWNIYLFFFLLFKGGWGWLAVTAPVVCLCV